MRRPVIRWGILIGVILLLALGLLILAGWAMASFMGPKVDADREFRSNGEQVFFEATSQRGTSITADVGMGQMGGGMTTCAGCHGPDGHGGKGRLMLRSFDAPDIRYATLTADGVGHDEEAGAHPPYTDETIKRAITQGVNPAGEPLEGVMPRWMMSDEDLDDLLDYLKSLP